MLQTYDNVGDKNWVSVVRNILFMYGFGFESMAQEADVKVSISVFTQRWQDNNAQE